MLQKLISKQTLCFMKNPSSSEKYFIANPFFIKQLDWTLRKVSSNLIGLAIARTNSVKTTSYEKPIKFLKV